MILLWQALLFHPCFLLFIYLFIFIFFFNPSTDLIRKLARPTYFIIAGFGKQQRQQDLYLCVLGYYVALLLSGDTT